MKIRLLVSSAAAVFLSSQLTVAQVPLQTRCPEQNAHPLATQECEHDERIPVTVSEEQENGNGKHKFGQLGTMIRGVASQTNDAVEALTDDGN